RLSIDDGAQRLILGNERADGKIRIDKVGVGDALQVLDRDLLHQVAVPEQQAPIAQGNILTQKLRDVGGGVHQALVVIDLLVAHPVELLLGKVLGANPLD